MAIQMDVRLDDGSIASLSSLHQTHPIALVFLRHFGCVFCRYQVAQLRGRPDLPVVFVCMEQPEAAAIFRSKMISPHRFISDPDRKLYEAFGVKRGTTGQILNFRTIARGIQATLSGSLQGRPTSDPRQLSATIILDLGGEVVWSQYADDASTITTAANLEAVLGRPAEKEA